MLIQYWNKVWWFHKQKNREGRVGQEIYSIVCLPTVKNVKHMVPTNIISNFLISVSGISNSEGMNVPSMEKIEFKTKRSKPSPVIKD